MEAIEVSRSNFSLRNNKMLLCMNVRNWDIIRDPYKLKNKGVASYNSSNVAVVVEENSGIAESM